MTNLISIVISIAAAWIALNIGTIRAIELAIDIAAKLEPNPKHSDHFEAYKEKAAAISRPIALGLVMLAWLAGLVAHGLISP